MPANADCVRTLKSLGLWREDDPEIDLTIDPDDDEELPIDRTVAVMAVREGLRAHLRQIQARRDPFVDEMNPRVRREILRELLAPMVAQAIQAERLARFGRLD